MPRFDKGKETPKEPTAATGVSAPETKPAPVESDFGDLDLAAVVATTVEPVAAVSSPADPVAAATASPAKAKAKTPGHTLCKVVNTDIFYRGTLIAEGTVAEFDDATVLGMPSVLVSVE